MEMGLGIDEIARRLERNPVPIHREIEREHCVEGFRPNFRSAFEDMLIHQGFIGRKCV
jgi:IS30 family transposase